jgi:hypothetical protein
MRLGETDQDYYLGTGNSTAPVGGDPAAEGRLAGAAAPGAGVDRAPGSGSTRVGS